MDEDGPLDYDDINSVNIVMNMPVCLANMYEPLVHTEIALRDLPNGGYLMPDGFTIFGQDAIDT